MTTEFGNLASLESLVSNEVLPKLLSDMAIALREHPSIDAVIATDSDQIGLDPRTRTQDGDPFPNTYHDGKTQPAGSPQPS